MFTVDVYVRAVKMRLSYAPAKLSTASSPNIHAINQIQNENPSQNLNPFTSNETVGLAPEDVNPTIAHSLSQISPIFLLPASSYDSTNPFGLPRTPFGEYPPGA